MFITIRVGMPSFRGGVTCPQCGRKGLIPTENMRTMDLLQAYDKSKIDFQLAVVSGTHCMRGRNISAMAKPMDGPAPLRQTLPYDYYLSTDDDMAFTPETIERLIAMDKDIIGAAYNPRAGNPIAIIACPIEGKSRNDWFRTWEHGLRECQWTGGGCILIKKTVFENMDYPWFRNNVIIENGCGDIQTEDVSFCSDARKAGFKVYIDLDNRVGHIPT